MVARTLEEERAAPDAPARKTSSAGSEASTSAPTDAPLPFPAEFLDSDEDGRKRMAQSEMHKVTAEVERALCSSGSLRHLGWTAAGGLEMPTAMHAHSAITVPLLPQTNWSQPASETETETNENE